MYFPIKQKPACQLKWTWSTIRLYEGSTSSCHRVDKELITAENFETFHNTPLKLEDRTKMLAGKWPGRGCEHCKHIEDAGGTSDRMHHLTIPNLTPVELLEDPTAIEVTPQIIEIYFDNVCNLSCLYCWDGFSSKIRSENNKYGKFDKDGVVIENHAKLVDNLDDITQKFWQYFEKHRLGVKRFHFLGGEPFYQKQLDYALNWFEKYPCPDLEFNIVSNMNIPHQRFRDYIEKIKTLVGKRCIRRFDLTSSIDCLGAEQEYVRYGMNLDIFKKNFEYVVDQKWIYLNFNQALSCLTVKTSPELIEYMNSLRHKRQINHFFSGTEYTFPFLHPRVFGSGFFDKDFAKIISLMPKDNEREITTVNKMQGLFKEINSNEKNLKQIKQLAVYLDELDRRRNTNWKVTFPWLTTEVDQAYNS